MTQTTASGNFSFTGLISGAVICIVAGLIAGALAHFIGRFFYLIILFPVVMGFIGLFAMNVAIKRGKIRNVVLAVVLALLFALTCYGSMHYFDYLNFRAQAVPSIMQSEDVDVEQAKLLMDEFLLGNEGFLGYMKFSAEQGVSIGRVGRSGGNIGRIGTMIYWAIEFLIIAAISFMGTSAARDPFCDRCDEWYASTDLFAVAPSSVSSLRQNMESGDIAAMTEHAIAQGETGAVVTAEYCQSCENNDVILHLNEIIFDNKGNAKTNETLNRPISFDEFATIRTTVINLLGIDNTSHE